MAEPFQHVFHLAEVEIIVEVHPGERDTRLRIGIDGGLAGEPVAPLVITEGWQAEYWATRSILKGYLERK